MKISNIVTAVKQKAVQTTLVAGSVVVSGAASANTGGASGGNNAAIQAAIDAGQSMVQTTTSGVIALAALGFGLVMVVSWLRK